MEQVTPLMKFIRNTKEKLLGSYEEGPEPPKRLQQTAELFARTNPKATVAQWLEFASELAGTSYQQGYVRGFERGERLGPDWQDPDEMAALLEHLEDAKLTGLPAFDPDAVVPVNGMPQEAAAKTAVEMAGYLERQGARRGPAPF